MPERTTPATADILSGSWKKQRRHRRVYSPSPSPKGSKVTKRRGSGKKKKKTRARRRLSY